MWTKELLGTDVYHLAAAFVLYSILGWFLESVYMSFCNRRLTNRGFAKSPFCPIYGFGAVTCYLILGPLRGHYVWIYLIGAVLATVFEYLVGRAMLFLFGELWWDYKEKPFNFQGIICLESTVAWGFYAIGVVGFVHAGIYWLIDRVDIGLGVRLVEAVLAVVAVDYVIQLTRAFHIDVRQKGGQIKERCRSILARWY